MVKVRGSYYLLIFLLCLFIFSNALHHDFLLDDYALFFYSHNLHTLKGFSVFFWHDFHGFYRPITCIFLKLTNLIFQNNPVGYHVVNLLLFILIGILFFELILWFSKSSPLALLASLLYVVHPINNIFVNAKVNSLPMLSILTMQISFLLLLRFLDRKKVLPYFLSLIFYFIGLLCHEMSALLPLYLGLSMRFIQGFNIRKICEFLWPYIMTLLVYSLLRAQVPDLRPLDTLFRLEITIPSYVATTMFLVFWYLSKLIFPRDIVLVWDTLLLKEDLLFWNSMFWLLLLVVLYLLIFRLRKGLSAFGLSVFFVGVVPVSVASFSNTFWFKTAYIEPQWFGFSSIGFFTLIAQGLLNFKNKIPQAIGTILIVILIGGLALWTQQSNLVWKDEETYCTYWLKVNPTDVTAKRGKAHAYIRKHDKGSEFERYTDRNEVLSLIEGFKLLGENEKAREYEIILQKMPKP